MSFLHHPPLDELSLLTGIATVDDHVGLLHQPLDDVELAFVGRITDEFDTEAGRYHGQAAQAPRLPARRIFMRLLQRTEMTERPGHLVSVSFDISVFLLLRSQHIGYVACHRGFLGYANDHYFFSCFYRAKIQI